MLNYSCVNLILLKLFQLVIGALPIYTHILAYKGLPVILRPISAGGISTGITPPSIKIIKQVSTYIKEFFGGPKYCLI